MATDNSYTLIWEVDSSSPIVEYFLQFKKQHVSYIESIYNLISDYKNHLSKCKIAPENITNYFYFNQLQSDIWLNLTIPAAGGARSTTFHSHAFNLRGLESGTNYVVQLSARNKFGWNSPSTVAVFSTLGPGIKYIYRQHFYFNLTI